MNISDQIASLLNAYVEAALGRGLPLPDADRLARQQGNFLREFGPDRLSTLPGSDLLRILPYNRDMDQPMDYWLEFRNDEVFSAPLFGSIAGGSAAKFGLWQDRNSGQWRARPPGSRTVRTITETEARRIVEGRRSEMLAAVEVLRPFARAPVEHLDPLEVQAAVAAAAPRWKSSAWLHKYLHLNFPERVTWRASLAYLQGDLQRLGITAGERGLYALDVVLIQFWNRLPALSRLPIPLRYRLTAGLVPRHHWCFRLTEADSLGEWMLASEMIALGPAEVGNLAGALSLSRKTEVRHSIERAFQEAGLVADTRSLQALYNLGAGLGEGDLLALVGEDHTVLAVGKVSGSYRHSFKDQRPHRVPIRWLQRARLKCSLPTDRTDVLFRLPPQSAAVAELEASLLLEGVADWPDFGINAGLPEQKPPAATPLSLGQPRDRIVRQAMAALQRKKQIVLYGPPGTGKTYYAEQTALELVARHNFHCPVVKLATWQRDHIWGRDSEETPYVAMCTFHPLYGYEDFIEGYRPEREGFSLRPGIFRRLATAAQVKPDKCFVLIVDEINRGNIPRIFGELITLLEPSKRGSIQVRLPLSGERFSVPANLYLIGTMNTADRSILLLDTALRRRFGFMELMPDPVLLQESRLGDFSLAVWLRALNRRIIAQLGHDGRNLQVGHAYFMPGGKPLTDFARFREILREDIWPLLQEYCYEDPQALAVILAAAEGGIYDPAIHDLRHALFEPGRESDLIKALQAMVEPQDEIATTDSTAARSIGHLVP